MGIKDIVITQWSYGVHWSHAEAFVVVADAAVVVVVNVVIIITDGISIQTFNFFHIVILLPPTLTELHKKMDRSKARGREIIFRFRYTHVRIDNSSTVENGSNK